MLVLVVDAGQTLAVKHAVVTAVVDPGAVLHTLKHRGSLRYQDTGYKALIIDDS